MNHASLFSGIGGFDLAAEWMGWNNVLSCEIDEFCNKVLKYHFPNAVHIGDIKQAKFKRDDRGNVYLRVNTDPASIGQGGDGSGKQSQPSTLGTRNGMDNEEEETWQNLGPIDIISGGFPCQPFSMAGKRRGTDDDRHLWPEMLRAIREIQPRWVVGENVYGLTNWDGGVVFRQVLSDLENEGYEVQPFIIPACSQNAPHRRDRVWLVAHRNTTGCKDRGEQCRGATTQDGEGIGRTGRCNVVGVIANSEGVRIDRETEYENGNRQSGERRRCNADNDGEIWGIIANTISQRGCSGDVGRENAVYANSRSKGDGFRRLWEGFPTQSPLRSRNDGFPGQLDGITVSKLRNESIKAAGNAIVPQVAFQIFKAIEQCELKEIDTCKTK